MLRFEALCSIERSLHYHDCTVLQIALKVSDLGHLCAPLPVHLKWVAALEEELFRQGDQEKAAGLAVSALMDRTKAGVTKSQSGVSPKSSH